MPGGVEGGMAGGVVGVPGGVIGAAATTAPLIIRVGGQIKAPKLLHRVDPGYPAIARQARITGKVLLHAIVDARGGRSGSPRRKAARPSRVKRRPKPSANGAISHCC
jgi:hypothetical protein